MRVYYTDGSGYTVYTDNFLILNIEERGERVMQKLDVKPDKDLYDNLILPRKKDEDFGIDIIDDNLSDYHLLKRRNKKDIDKAIRKVIKKLKIKIEIDNDDKKVYMYVPEVFIKKLSEDYSDIGLGKRVVWRDEHFIFTIFGVEKDKLRMVCKDISDI